LVVWPTTSIRVIRGELAMSADVEPMAASAQALPASIQAELVSRAARGDATAFEQLVSTRAERAFRIASAILGSEADARDATQDAFVLAWRELPRLRDPEHFDAWLRRILVNACRASLRTRKGVREISLDVAPDPRAGGPAMADQVGDIDLLSRAFDRLDADKRTILVLHYMDHESVAAIASALRVPVGTAKWRLSEARAALRRALTAEGETRP
jgi:RNA polymerase sigma-70 factor (ECF subfamily)